jgi:hypothetical protein
MQYVHVISAVSFDLLVSFSTSETILRVARPIQQQYWIDINKPSKGIRYVSIIMIMIIKYLKLGPHGLHEWKLSHNNLSVQH